LVKRGPIIDEVSSTPEIIPEADATDITFWEEKLQFFYFATEFVDCNFVDKLLRKSPYY